MSCIVAWDFHILSHFDSRDTAIIHQKAYMLTMCLINKKEHRCDRDNIFKILSRCILIFLPHSGWQPFPPLSYLGKGSTAVGCVLWVYGKVKYRRGKEVEIVFLGLWEEEGDKIWGRCGGSMRVLTLLALAGVQRDMWMCVCGRGSIVRWRYKLGAEDILELMAKTTLPNEPQLGAARLRSREKDWVRTLEPEWDGINAQIPIGQRWWLAISQLFTPLSSKVTEAYFGGRNSSSWKTTL